MKHGKIDLDTNFEYLIIYVDEEGNKSTWTLPDGSFQINYQSMKKRGVNILGVYKKLKDNDLLSEICR